MANLGYGFYPTHPGEVLKEELECRGISQKKFSELIGVSYTQLNEILNGKRSLSADFAYLVEAATGIAAEALMKLQVKYNMYISKHKPSLLK